MPVTIKTSTETTEVVGPLSSLFTNSFEISRLHYPEDLSADGVSNTKKPHVVKFFVNVPENSTYISGNKETILETKLPASNEPPLQGPKQLFKIGLSPLQYRLRGDISLYIPDSMNMSFDVGYQDDNLNDYSLPFFGQIGKGIYDELKSAATGESGVKNLISGLAKYGAAAVKSQLSGSVPIDILLKGQGVAINPQVQLLFKAVALRTFSMEFMFSPKSQQEAQTVQQIIQTFKFHAAPEVGGGEDNKSGLFFVVPSTFNIQFLFNGEENTYIQRIGQCVLENVSVDYAPNGWSTFHDGSPTQTRLTLQFKETDIIDKSMVEKGY